jgi:iron complex outermembrane receptor protein
MRHLGIFSSVSVLALTSVGAIAQEAVEPQAQLPAVTVETKQQPKKATPKKKAVQKKSKSAAPKVAAPKAAPAAPPAQQPSPPAGQASGPTGESAGKETALGPVKGIVATRSATGSKTDTPIVEVPRTVNVITRDQITVQQPRSVKEALDYTPAVQSQVGASSILDTIAVRGFPAPIFLNGLLLPTDSGINFAKIRLEPYGLERLEVLKGPSSGLFGQSPPGGLINAVSKRPQFTPSNEIFFQVGNHDHVEAGFDFTGPLDKSGKYSYRLVGLTRDGDFDFDYADKQRYFIAPSFTFRPSADTTLTILGTAQRDEGFGPHQFVPLELTKKSAQFGRISRKTYLGEPDVDDYLEDQWQVGYALEHRFDSVFQFRQNLRYSESDQTITAMRTVGMAAPDSPEVARGINFVGASFEGFAVDNQLQADFATGRLRHRVLAGLDYQHVDSSSEFWVNNNASPIDYTDPVYGQPPIPSPFAGLNFVLADSTLEQTGLYLQDQIKFGKWIATLGGRHDWATTEMHDKRAAAAHEFQEIDDQAWTGFAGLSYLFDNGFAPYVNYSTSFLPATGSNLYTSNAPDAVPLEPTTGEGYEAGIKYQPFGTKTLISAAIFQNTQQNIKSTDVATGATVQTGEVRVRGIEIEGKASLTDNFDVIAGYSYLEPIITKDVSTSTVVDRPSNVGNDFLQVSRHLASLWGMYTWHDGPLAGFGLGAGVRYVGTQYAQNENINKVPAYTLVDAAMTYDLKYLSPEFEGAKLQLNALNLFDKYYVQTCQSSAAFCQLGQSRTFLATVKYQW